MIHRPHGTADRGRRYPGVVFFHGFTGDRMESHWLFVNCSRALSRAGIASLRFDFYGSGESEGEFTEVTLQGEIADARTAVAFFRRRTEIDSRRIGLVGLSLGGAIAATIASDTRARALVLWAAIPDPRELHVLAETWTRPVSGNEGAREYCGHQVSAAFLKNVGKVRPLKSVARYNEPTLIIHPENDEFLPLSHPEAYFQALGANVKEKVIVQGADHTFTSTAWETEVIGRTVEWFRRYLPAQPRP